MSDYRKGLYTNYATDFKGGSQQICQKKIDKFWPIFKKTTQGWLPDSTTANILDLGCGNGTNMSLLKNKLGYCNVYGVDLSESQVSLAQQHVTNVQLGNALDYLGGSLVMFDLISPSCIFQGPMSTHAPFASSGGVVWCGAPVASADPN